MKKIKKVILSGGGTGGHIYPALSIYNGLKKRYPDIEVLYIGTQKGLESTIVPKAGIPFRSIEIQGLKRSLSIENIKTIYQTLISTMKAKKLVKSFKPDVVIGTGGYVCAPVLLAASFLSIPTFIHEQNSVAGVTNKLLSRFSDRIGICFPEAKESFKGNEEKIVLTGNPRGQEVANTAVDREILATQFNLDPSKSTVLIFGGSRGAPAINNAALSALDNWVSCGYQVIIATGTTHYDELLTEYELDTGSPNENVRIVSYIDDMPKVLQAIDLVVSRSGATTLTEITALGLASILIPSPYVTNNHQEHNAMSLVMKEAAKMIKEAELDGNKLANMVNDLMSNPAELNQMAKNAKELGIPNATDLIIEEIEKMI